MIKLLNGDAWNKEEVLTQMYSDEFYYDHLGKYCLSSSSLKTVLKSPKTYRNVLKYGNNIDSPALRAGKLLHWMILEPRTLDSKIFVDVKTRTTKVYKEALAEHGEVYLESERSAAERLADALLRNEAALELLNKAEFEVPEIAMIDGLPFRGKADILKQDQIIDLKTTQDLTQFRWSAEKYGYNLQAWMYCKMFNIDKFTFLVIDKGSCDIGVFEASKEFIKKGKEKFNQAVSNYKYFFEENNDLDQYVLRGIL